MPTHNHTHPNDPDAHVACAAHRTLAYALADGLTLTGRHVAKAIDRKAGIQAVVILTAWAPPRLHLNGGRGQRFAPANSPTPLRDVEAFTLEAAPAHDARPVSVRQLARLAGYKDTGHFREAVNQLLERGLLVRIRGGVRKANPPG